MASAFSGKLPDIGGGLCVSLGSFLGSTAGRKLRSSPPPGSENRLPVGATVLLLSKLSFLDTHEEVAEGLPCDELVALYVVFLDDFSKFHGAGRVVGPVLPGNPVAVLLCDLDVARILGGINDGFRPSSLGTDGALLPNFCTAPDGGFHGAFGPAFTTVSLEDGAVFKLFPAGFWVF